MCFGLRNAAQMFQHRWFFIATKSLALRLTLQVCFWGWDVNLSWAHHWQRRLSSEFRTCRYHQRLAITDNKKDFEKRFLGSMNFYIRFISNAADIRAPLYDLTTQVKRRGGPLLWTDATWSSFESCRAALANSAVLAHPRSDAQLRLSTDASLVAVGAVLKQKSGKSWQPLGFFSKKLFNTETKYSTYGRELLAVFLGTRHFIHLIEGRFPMPRTDHKSLIYMFTLKTEKIIDRQIRHISFLSQYISRIEHVSSEHNVIPDAL